VHALADALDAVRLTGVHGIVPTYDSLLVEFDCAATDHDTVRRVLGHEAARLGPHPGDAPPRRRSSSRWSTAASTAPTFPRSPTSWG
jgi:hypothetical protein